MTGKHLAPVEPFFIMFVQLLPPHQNPPVVSLAISYLATNSFSLKIKS